MKIKKYERFSLIITISIIIIIFEIIYVFFLVKTKEYKYETVTGIVVKDNLIDIIILEKEKNTIYKNKYIYLNDKKINFNIKEEQNNIYKHNGKKYCKLLMNFNFDKKYKTGDIISISIKKEKYRQIEMFKLIWDGD